MRRIIAAVFMGALGALVTGAREFRAAEHDTTPFVVIRYAQLNFIAGGTSSRVCLVIDNDADFVLERKIQKLPADNAKAMVFRSHLSDDERSELRSILTTSMQLPPWIKPATPLTVSQMEILTVKSRPLPESDFKTVGYFSWIGPASADGYPAEMPSDVKSAWRTSKAALEPMKRWVDSVESMNLVPVSGDGEPQCSE